jgi:glutathione S-transferase
MTTRLGMLAGRLAKTAPAVGVHPSIAGISMSGWLSWPDEFGVSGPNHPGLARWRQAIRAIAGWGHPCERMPGHPRAS